MILSCDTRIGRFCKPRVFRRDIIKLSTWVNMDDRENLISDNSDGQFFACDKLLYKNIFTVLNYICEGGFSLFLGFADMNSYA